MNRWSRCHQLVIHRDAMQSDATQRTPRCIVELANVLDQVPLVLRPKYLHDVVGGGEAGGHLRLEVRQVEEDAVCRVG